MNITILRCLFMIILFTPLSLLAAETNSESAENRKLKKLKLESTIVGNKELPKVMTIVPWQLAQQGTVDSSQFSAEIRSIFEPIEVSSLKKELEYFNRRKK